MINSSWILFRLEKPVELSRDGAGRYHIIAGLAACHLAESHIRLWAGLSAGSLAWH